MYEVDQAWKVLMGKHKETVEALEVLKAAIKSDCTQHIQTYIENEEFALATKLLADLNAFTKVQFVSNVEDIEVAFRTVIDERQSKPQKVIAPTPPKQAIIASAQVTSDNESDALRIIGYSGAARVKDEPKLNESTVRSLIEKGLLLSRDSSRELTFELTKAGRQQFYQQENMEANESILRDIERKADNLDTALFYYDLENAIIETDLSIEKWEGRSLELSHNNTYYHATVDDGMLTEEDYKQVMDAKHRLKSIGFICVDEQTLAFAKEQVDRWVEENKSKCKFMKIHYGTLERIAKKMGSATFEVISL
jgi:hypothetical protein